jgi:hypothetical protein
MGHACRKVGDRGKLLAIAALGVRHFMTQPKFWEEFSKTVQEVKKDLPKFKATLDGKDGESAPADDCFGLEQEIDAACVAALMQILAPESAEMRKGLVEYLSKIRQVEATQALARLALFSAEGDVRHAAVDALKNRRKKHYQAILLDGLRYPLPEVAQRAGEALVALERKDLVPRLVDLLDAPDPRLPMTQKVRGKAVSVVRELVRVNHHRNCMLCHAPAAVGAVKTVGKGDVQVILAMAMHPPVPLSTEPLPPPSQGYDFDRKGSADILVRIDTTYLRQDFSLMLPVADAAPWPDRQRYDYFVRSRVLTEREAEAYCRQAPKASAGGVNPYQRSVVLALRELTGRDAAPTAQAWHALLKAPEKAAGR